MTSLLHLAALLVAALTVAASAFTQSPLPLASTTVVVNPDGSATIENVPLSDGGVGETPSAKGLAAGQESVTVDFNDLASGEGVAPDRYIQLGLRIAIGPSSQSIGMVIGSLIDSPCNETRSMQTSPFTGPSFLL